MSEMVPLYGFGGGGGGTGATLTVAAPAGCTVTISKDGKSKTKVAGSDGVAVFKGLATGEWTVTITDGEQTAQKIVTVTADYATAITFFEATIHITYPAGSVCTATDGVTTLTAPDTSGTWECVVPNAGEWTVSLDSGFSENVMIAYDGETQTLDKWYLYKNGNEHTNLTGGWSADGYTHYNPLKEAQKEENRICFIGSNSYNQLSGTENTIDISRFSTIYVDLEVTGVYSNGASLNIVIGYDKIISNMIIEQDAGSIKERKTIPIDVSAVDGNVYIAVFVQTSADCSGCLYNCWGA